MSRAFLVVCTLLASTVSSQTTSPQSLISGGVLIGVVRNPVGATLSDVNVTLLGESSATRTDGDGHFALRDVADGSHTVLFRRIGYGSQEYRWISKAGGVSHTEVVMTPLAQQLNRIVVEAPGTSRKRGTSSIGGSVIDSAGHAVGGVDVRLLGSGMSTTTDSTGRFDFETLAAGPYIVRARQQGMVSANYVMQIADDDARGITLKMRALPRGTKSGDRATQSGYGVLDLPFDAFDRRERGASPHVMLGPGDLFRANGVALDFVLSPYLFGTPISRRSGSAAGVGSDVDGDCLLIDGRRAAYQPLRTFTSRDVQLVEVIRANVWPDESILFLMESLSQCRGTMDRHPNYILLWTRALH